MTKPTPQEAWSSAPPVSDLELVMRAKNGEKQAFNSLVIRYQYRLRNLISRYTSDPVEAMDLTQEVFIKAYRALPNFRSDSAFYTWIYRIAVNTVKNHLQKQDRRPPDTDIDILVAEQFSKKTRLKELDSPEHQLLRDEIQATVTTVLESLPDDLREALVLREFEGLTYEEIADRMGCPIGTVRSRIFRAREAMDEKLKPLLREND